MCTFTANDVPCTARITKVRTGVFGVLQVSSTISLPNFTISPLSESV